LGVGLLCIYVNNLNYILVIIKYKKVRMTKKAYAIYIFTSESMTDLIILSSCPLTNYKSLKRYKMES
jgi:hypothetical protein